MKNINNKILICIIMAFLVVCIVYKIKSSDIGLAGAKNIGDIDTISFEFDALLPEESKNSFVENADDYVSDFKKGDNIFTGTATGKIHQEYYSLLQEVRVDKVIHGTVKVGDVIWVEETSGISYSNSKIAFLGTINVMQKNGNYLFSLCNNKDYISKYEGKDLFHTSSFFSFLSTTKWSTKVVEYNKIYSLKELKDYEFFSDSKDVILALNKLKKVILSNYNIDIS